MSELIQQNDNRATIRWKLLTGVSALALAVSSANMARAEDTDHPLIWIELGGEIDMMQGLSRPFTAPFMSVTPQSKPGITPAEPDVYAGSIFLDNQKPPKFDFGFDGSISFQPQDSDWIFDAAIRYGRAHTSEHKHQQGAAAYAPKYNFLVGTTDAFPLLAAPLADVKTRDDEKHMILDFSAGKDLGMGMFGPNSESTISAGVRFAQFVDKTDTSISARPGIGYIVRPHSFFGFPKVTFYQYSLTGHADRSFKGVGPSLSWKASAPIAGNAEDGELSLDWGINGALLFGRQKARVDHKTKDSHLTQAYCSHPYTSGGINYCGYPGYTSRYQAAYPTRERHQRRSHSVMVPNLGGFAALTAQFRDAKVSIGYRYDTFLSAMDTGIDTRKTSNLTFNGPYVSISVGLGD